LELRLDVKCEECETLTSDLERANVRLSEIDGQTATVVEKVGDRCNYTRLWVWVWWVM